MITIVHELKVITVTERITGPLYVGAMFFFHDGVKLVTKRVVTKNEYGQDMQRLYVDNV